MTATLEERATGGLASWLSIQHDRDAGQLVLRIVRNRDHLDCVACVITFTAIRDLTEEPFDPAGVRAKGLEHLIGLDEHAVGAGLVRYVIATDERELTFLSAKAPVVEELPA